MRQKISDNLLGFKLIILRSELNVETDRSKISSDKKCVFFDVSLYTRSFFANSPFKNYSSSFNTK